MGLTAGIDVGSTYAKVVIVDENKKIVGKSCFRSGYNFADSAEEGLALALEDGGIQRDDIEYIAATGFGRYMVPIRDLAITELTCHGHAAHSIFPGARLVLDVGGQGVKAIRLDEKGRVRAFRLNDKCAAGSGAFLEKTVRYMGYEVEDIVDLVEKSTDAATVSSVCAVFAESEVINHLTGGRTAQDVCAGAIASLGQRASQLVKRVRPEPEYVLSGGLSRVPMMKRILDQHCKADFKVAPNELGVLGGALGAALLARSRLQKLARQTSA